MKLSVAEQKVYITKRSLREDERSTDEVEYIEGGIEGPGPRLRDETIESRTYRSKYTSPGEGMICISVEPGDELGQIVVNIQFEGPAGQHDQCIRQQNGILKEASEVLAEFFGEMGADFQVRIGSVPCPDAMEKINLAAVVNRLEGRVEDAVRHDLKREVPINIQQKAGS